MGGPTITHMAGPTLRDVADAAGVHTATASRALNVQTRGLVSAKTAKRVLRAAETLGYVANPIARSLKTSRTRTIGVVLPDLTNPFFPPVVRGVQDVLKQAGYSGLIVNTDNDPEIEAAQVASLEAWKVEGLVVATALLDHPLLARLHERALPMVMVNRWANGVSAPSVTPDDAAGIESAVQHLAGLGHRRILHLAGPSTTSTGVMRRRAFQSAVREAGLVDDPALVAECAYFSEAEGARVLRSVLDAGVEYTAVVAGNDLLALGCYDLFAERGIRCPDDVSVVGFNDMPFLDKLNPPLTTVHVPHQQMGEEACRMLIEIIDDPKRAVRSVVLPVSLLVRGSTGPRRG